MIEEIYQKINTFKENSLHTFIFASIINCLFIFYLIYRAILNQTMVIVVIIFIVVFLLDSLWYFSRMFSNSKQINIILLEQLIPYMLNQVNYEFQLSNEKFLKEDTIKSLFISKYGSFSSYQIVKGTINHIPIRFSYVTSIISNGKSSYDVFSGTYLSFKLQKKYDGIIQLRDKGRIEKNKKLDLVCHPFIGEIVNKYPNIHCFTNHDRLAVQLMSENLFALYDEIKKETKKGLYLSIFEDELVIGIHDRNNLFRFPALKKINSELYDKKISLFNKIYRVIDVTAQYINDNLNN